MELLNDRMEDFYGEHYHHYRHLQEFPTYTSPPTELALNATPSKFRNDQVIEDARKRDAEGLCHGLPPEDCQIIFQPPTNQGHHRRLGKKSKKNKSNNKSSFSSSSKLGVILYGGALVDPRSYSPIADRLASGPYRIPTVIPIFDGDIAFSPFCDTGRIDLASAAFPNVEQWVLAGHSLGGVGAQNDFFTKLETTGDKGAYIVAGLVLFGSRVIPGSCGINSSRSTTIDFAKKNYPNKVYAVVTATNDLILNQTDFDATRSLLPEESTFHMDILGGNHQQFGSYDASLRQPILGQVDGNATLAEEIQLDLSTSAIMNVISRTGFPLVTYN